MITPQSNAATNQQEGNEAQIPAQTIFGLLLRLQLALPRARAFLFLKVDVIKIPS
jgi:hypothetical protein